MEKHQTVFVHISKACESLKLKLFQRNFGQLYSEFQFAWNCSNNKKFIWNNAASHIESAETGLEAKEEGENIFCTSVH